MKIIILNGSPRPDGNTAAMINAYRKGAESAGHSVSVFDICRMNIKGCLACEYCHTKAFRTCVQQDDMQKIYPLLDEAEMIVLASPVYYHGFSGQLQCAINRIYAPGYPKKLRKAALLLSSGSDGVYDGAVYTYRNSFIDYLHLEDMGIFTAAGEENKSEAMLARLTAAGGALTDPDDHNIARLAISSGDVTVKAKLNNTIAARDLMNRLPMTVEGYDSGVDYCCSCEDGMIDEREMQDGWKNGDINLSGGWFAILYGGEEQSSAYHQMIVAHLSEEDNCLIRALPKETMFRLSLEEPYRSKA
ncbi:MAG: NAD(P)H-dependent oxidoreductase [Clostridiales bacterium]|nr:NAD(P)H-dependent oxidoreductase [Clostridiales bacterium]